MPQPVEPAKRRQAVLLMQRGDLGRNEIARRLELSGAAVTKIAQQVGHTFDRTQTALAVQARSIELSAARMDLAKLAIAEAYNVVDDFRAPVEVAEFDSTAGVFRHYVRPEPSIMERQRLAYTLTLLTKAAADLSRAEDGAGVTAGIALVQALGMQLDAVLNGQMLDDVDPTEAPEADR